MLRGVEPQPLAQAAQHLLVRRRGPAVARGVDRRPGGVVHARLERRLELLPDPGNRAPQRRPDVGQVGDDLPGVGAVRELGAVDQRGVVRDDAVGDVGGGQVGDHAPAGGARHDRVDGPPLRHHVGVGELHALGRPGRSRGVDERDQVLGRDGLPGGVEVEARASARGQLVERLDDHDVLEGGAARLRGLDPIEERRLGDEHTVARVAQQVLDLLRRRGVVDRERHRAEVHRRDVHEVELGAIREHERHRVAPLHAETGEPGREVSHALGVLAPGDRRRVAQRAQRHLVGHLRGAALEGLAQRRRLQAGGRAGTRVGRSRRHRATIARPLARPTTPATASPRALAPRPWPGAARWTGRARRRGPPPR